MTTLRQSLAHSSRWTSRSGGWARVSFWPMIVALLIFCMLCHAYQDLNRIIYLFFLFGFSLFFLVFNPRVRQADYGFFIAAILSIFVFYVIPMVFFFLLDFDLDLALAPITLLFTAFIIHYGKLSAVKVDQAAGQNTASASTNAGIEILLHLIALGSSFLTFVASESTNDAGGATIIYFSSFSLIVFLYEFGLKRRNFGQIARTSITIALMLGFYLTTVWTGFGRIYLGMLAIPLYALLIVYGFTRYRPLAMVAASVVIIVGGNILRFGTRSDMSTVLSDSTTSGLVLTDELWNTTQVAALPSDMRSQFVLFLFNWVPRSLWGEKPVAVGASFVDYYLGRDGFGEGHSIALGLVGEHLYFMNEWWAVSLLIAVFLYCLLRRMIAKVSTQFYSPLVLFDANFITFLWGGLAAFGARWVFLTLPALLAAIAFSWLLRNPTPAAQRAQTGVVG